MSISISKRLSSLNLTYPLWLFDPDQPPWPRKLSSVLPGSRPAKITGWYPWHWEYGTDLYRNDDPISANVIDTRPRDVQRLGDVARVLEMLRYDDTFREDTFEVVFESGGGKGEETKHFEEWVFEGGDEGYVDPRRVLRVWRRWDGVPFWDRGECWNLFDEGEAGVWRSFGVASLVRDEGELVAASGVRRGSTGGDVRKAEFGFLDGGMETVRGIVFPKRHQVNHGLTPSRGPQFLPNRELLAGTALEGAPWSDVEAYVRGEMAGPLWS